MADAGDLKSPARKGRVGSNPTSAIEFAVRSYGFITDYYELSTNNYVVEINNDA